MKGLVSLLAAALMPSLAACGAGHSRICATPASPSVRLPAVPGRPAAGYFEILAGEGSGALLSVTSPRVARIEMHESMMSDSMSTMRPMTRATADECHAIAFAPGGRHLMLFDVDPAVRAGQEIELVLHFENGESRRLTARIEAAGGEAR
jgi:copper(I)-binding protein